MTSSAADNSLSRTFKLPKLEQIAFVVDDLHKSIKHWAEVYGVGPFVVREHIEYTKFQFEGEDSAVDYSLAQAWHGDVQIELLQQHNDAPSVLSKFRVPRGCVHHFGTLASDFEADEARMLSMGFKCAQRVVLPNGSLLGFYTGGEILGMVELIWLADGGIGWNKFKEAAKTWDRRSPYLE